MLSLSTVLIFDFVPTMWYFFSSFYYNFLKSYISLTTQKYALFNVIQCDIFTIMFAKLFFVNIKNTLFCYSIRNIKMLEMWGMEN
jgi:hypothetical protein